MSGQTSYPLVAPSILAANFGKLQEQVEMLNHSAADWIHVDVMDGHFVPNISFGFPIMEVLKKHSRKPLDVHLMISNPDQYIRKFVKAGANRLTVHVEACPHLDRTLRSIRELGVSAGVALNPSTPVEQLRNIIHLVDQVCVMSVNPGFGGQEFIENTYDKLLRVKHLIYNGGSGALIQVDGGIDQVNAARLHQHKVDVIVAGSFIFESASPLQTIKELKAVNSHSGSAVS